MNAKYEAVFYAVDNGYFTVVCRGYFRREHKPGCVFPTVEEAITEYKSNATFIGLK